MRAFVAVEVPSDGSSRHAAPDHLTLRFLGEVDPAIVPGIEGALRPVANSHAPFDLRLEGVGAFPSRERPRVVWVGATDGADALRTLARDAGVALRPFGGAEEDRFVPHLTLFRVRSRPDRERAAALLSGGTSPPPPRTVRVREFVLKESRLHAGGAEHRTLATFALVGRALNAD